MKLIQKNRTQFDTWIFGDSFSDDLFVFKDHKNWYDYLDNVSNFSHYGIGATRLFKIFLQQISIVNFDVKNVNLIYLLPDCYRLDLDYLPDFKLSANAKNLRDILLNNEDKKLILNNIKKHKNFLNDNSQKIFDDYESFYRLGITEIFPVLMISTIFSFSSMFNKVIIIPCNNVYFQHNDTRSLNIDFSFIDFISEKYSNVYYLKQSLLDLSNSEGNMNEKYKLDNRNNHLKENSHIILKNTIIEWFYNNIKKELL